VSDRARFAGVKAVFFDVDNTLYDFEDSMRHAFAHLHEAFPDTLGQHEVDLIESAYWRAYNSLPEDEKVRIINTDPALFRRTMWAAALGNLGLDARLDGHALDITTEFQRLRPQHWRAAAYPGMRDALLELKPRFTLGAITNGPSQVQRPKLEALGYLDFFAESRVFVSGEFGARKPDPSIFLAAAKSAGVAPESCVMVGDALEFDMPAKAVGFRTILFDGKKKAPDVSRETHLPDAIVTSYREILALLQ
jgi:putative hydrolase of the HAD superfamily